MLSSPVLCRGALEEDQRTPEGHNKAKAAQRWVNAVNQWGQHGRWHYVLVDDPPKLGPILDTLAEASSDNHQGITLSS